MNHVDRQIEALVELINEYVETENNIASLPIGYISVKNISGKTYYYRQWREDNKIRSEYVSTPLLNSVKRKIMIRKENEQLLKMIRKDYQKMVKKIVKDGTLTEENINELLEAGRRGEGVAALAESMLLNN